MNKIITLHNEATKNKTGVVIDVRNVCDKETYLRISSTSLDFKVKFEASVDGVNYCAYTGQSLADPFIFQNETSKNSRFYFPTMRGMSYFRAPVEVLDEGKVTVEFTLAK